jgi:hypothetical protein
VIALVPWERQNRGFWTRLWSTARLSTTSCDSFFGTLSDGPIAPAVRFGVACELIAIVGLVTAFMPAVFLLAPELVSAIVKDAPLRSTVLRALASALPALALMMVGVHALHGVALELGAARQGSDVRYRRGLRFGLYACGWDLVTLPAGLALLAVLEGTAALGRALPLGWTAPGRAAKSYLMNVHQLDEGRARSAAHFALGVTSIAVLFVALTTAAAGVVAALL